MIVALPDGPDFVAALFGILRRGSVVVMVNPDAPPELIHYFLEYTRATRGIRPRRPRSASSRAPRPACRARHGCTPSTTTSFRPGCDAQPGERRAVRLASRRRRDLAVQRRHDRPAEGRRADASLVRQHDGALRTRRARHRSRRRHDLGAEAVLRVRHRREPLLPVLGRRVVRPVSGALHRRERSSPRSRGTGRRSSINVPTMVQQMVAHPDARRRTSRACGSRPPPARRCPPSCTSAGCARSASSCSTASAPPRCGTSSSPTARATSCRARWAAWCPGFEVKLCDADGHEVARRRGRRALGQGRIARDRLLAADGRHRARVSRRMVRVGRHAAPQPRRDVHLLRPLRRHAEGERQMGGARRARELPADPPGGARSRRRRREERGRPRRSRTPSSWPRRLRPRLPRNCRSMRNRGSSATSIRARSSSWTRCRGHISARSIAARWQSRHRAICNLRSAIWAG